jgi:hypothetical protein
MYLFVEDAQIVKFVASSEMQRDIVVTVNIGGEVKPKL